MRHDLTHEKRQNEALVHLAQAVEAVAAHCGMSGAKNLAKHVEDILQADESEPAEDVKVEIVVKGDADPSRVARLAAQEAEPAGPQAPADDPDPA